jgi:hypothetical protein
MAEYLAKTKIATLAQSAAQKVAAAGTKAWAGVQWLMNSALLASPITWIVVGIIALVAVIVIIATKTHWFQNIWKVAWGGIKAAASNTWDFVKKIPGWVVGAFGKIGNAISAPFRAGFNAISRAWNNTVGRLSWSVPGWVPFLGGDSISVPNLPTFHSGGTVPGVVGSPQLAILQGGETVQSRASSTAGGDQWIKVDLGDLGDALLAPIAKAVAKRGGRATHLGILVVNGAVRA